MVKAIRPNNLNVCEGRRNADFAGSLRSSFFRKEAKVLYYIVNDLHTNRFSF